MRRWRVSATGCHSLSSPPLSHLCSQRLSLIRILDKVELLLALKPRGLWIPVRGSDPSSADSNMLPADTEKNRRPLSQHSRADVLSKNSQGRQGRSWLVRIFSNDSWTILACTSSPKSTAGIPITRHLLRSFLSRLTTMYLFSFARLTTSSSLTPGLTLVVIHPRSLRYSSRPNSCSSRRTVGLCIFSALSILDGQGLLRNLTSRSGL